MKKPLQVVLTFPCESAAEAMFFATTLQEVEHYENASTGFAITAPDGWCFSSALEQGRGGEELCVVRLVNQPGRMKITSLRARQDVDAIRAELLAKATRLLADDQIALVVVLDQTKSSWGSHNVDPSVVPAALRELADKLEAQAAAAARGAS